MDKNEFKKILKEAMKEWLNDAFATFGRWSASAFAAAVFIALVYFVLKINGWTPPSNQVPIHEVIQK